MKNRSHLKGIGRKTDNRKKAVTFLLAMALCLLGAGGRTSLAAVADESQGTVIIEYNNLRELLKQGNLSLKESIEDYEDNINAYQEIWDTLKREQDNMEDKACLLYTSRCV